MDLSLQHAHWDKKPKAIFLFDYVINDLQDNNFKLEITLVVLRSEKIL